MEGGEHESISLIESAIHSPADGGIIEIGEIVSSPEHDLEISEICSQLRHLSSSKPTPVAKSKSLWLALEAHIELKGVSDSEIQLIYSETHRALTLAPDINDKWLQRGLSTECYYHPLRVVLKLKPTVDQAFLVIAATTLHYMEGLPWTDHRNASISANILSSSGLVSLDNQFSSWLAPQLLTLSPTSQQALGRNLGNKSVSNAGYKQRLSPNAVNGLRPSLGFNLGYEDGARSEWKHSQNVMVIACVYYTINQTDLGDNWPLISSFILNLLEDHEVFFKTQGCILLKAFITKNPSILIKSGLQELYLSAVKVCMSYLPNLTPEEDSLYILTQAYPTAFQLIPHISKPIEGYILMLNENMFSTIQYVKDRSDKVVVLILEFIDHMIHNCMKSDVFVCLSRLFYTINQLVTGPMLFDRKKKTAMEISSLCLKIQADVFVIVEREGNHSLLHKYGYDFIAVWSVLYQRLSREGLPYDGIIENYNQLRRLDGGVEEIAKEVCLIRPGLRLVFIDERRRKDEEEEEV